MRTRRNGLVLLVAALASAACGGSSGGSSDDGSVAAGGAGSVSMAMNNFSFSPAVLNGTPGEKQTIHLTNSSGTEHNFTLEDQKVDKDVESGATADVTVTFPASGQLVFVCSYHQSKGMTGTLSVGGAAPSAAPTMSDKGGGGSY
jgi:plastocyanin